MPQALLAPGEHYHIYNRGINKQKIFNENSDYARMLFILLFFQADITFHNIAEHVNSFQTKTQRGGLGLSGFSVSPKQMDRILRSQTVSLAAFALMPNHFHLLVFEKEEGGISKYLSRLENSYTKYFNAKYQRSGYLLQGPFQSVHLETNEQALYLSAYIHRNPREIMGWKGREHLYPWSSYRDYLGENRWQEFLNRELILEQFFSPSEYQNYVETSGAKEIEKDFLLD